jgi:hypothetical protein
VTFAAVRRGGAYLRVADPSWKDPLDRSYSILDGGRWNAPGSFGVVYLNRTIEVARANVRRRFAGRPYGLEDLEPAEAPVLVSTTVPQGDFVDVVGDAGCRAAGLPDTYPAEDGEKIPHSRCQPIGRRAWDEGWPGIACRSAAPGCDGDDEELAWFEREERLPVATTRAFDDWFWPPGPPR